ncbi:hypothetical protein FPSE_06958 [Fusarium pseudograminearum CS3096]|uniref:Zn(2)-C6 fungal-type domain-containing protein n=1 Tax=Fusarium pseudograminearum (strain CS3096) TaxID=1028729 RepID=K3VFH0_FUSPC|nr:hypothetical protein FPSE_06958 [Fusarium pseudograminearum CS3096]EKJ72912.1 hypothetical protein FPSE_06958 [Fusarium pseudograminearum CS3096]
MSPVIISKRRHVKCDEGRPACLLCTMTGRDCSFTLEEGTSSASDISSRESLFASIGHNTETTTSATPPDSHGISFGKVVNMEHMELFVHLVTTRDLFSLGDNVDDYQSTFEICLKESVKAPYLLHQMLAFSARHLAAIHPDRTSHYLEQAVSLQTRAVSLFNETSREVDSSNCVAILLFSVTLGHHLLADALAYRGPDGLDGFLAHYVQCVDLNRGIYNVVVSAWPLLADSELEPVLSWSKTESAKEPRGTECLPIIKLITESKSLTEDEKKACQVAINFLQLGFDAIASEEKGSRYRMIFQWTMLASPDFTTLLSARKPEALILLSYYALLLHYGRKLWQIRDTGMHLMGFITDNLPSEWHFWLDYPRSILSLEIL